MILSLYNNIDVVNMCYFVGGNNILSLVELAAKQTQFNNIDELLNSDLHAEHKKLILDTKKLPFKSYKQLQKLVNEEIYPKIIIFDDEFDEDISLLDNIHTLEHISFGYSFNDEIGSLKKLINLQTLFFGNSFNQSIIPLKNLIKDVISLTSYII